MRTCISKVRCITEAGELRHARRAWRFRVEIFLHGVLECRMTNDKTPSTIRAVRKVYNVLLKQEASVDQKRWWLWRGLAIDGPNFPLKRREHPFSSLLCSTAALSGPHRSLSCSSSLHDRSTRPYRMSEHTLHRRNVTATDCGAPLAKHKHRVLS